MTGDLTTTNVLLGVLATVSVLEAVAVLGMLLGGFLLFRRLLQLLTAIEARHVGPAAERVNAILDDVKAVSALGKQAAERADRMAGWWRVFRGA